MLFNASVTLVNKTTESFQYTLEYQLVSNQSHG